MLVSIHTFKSWFYLIQNFLLPDRNDHLSKGFIYENLSKEKKFIISLPKRLKTVNINIVYSLMFFRSES